MSIRKISHSIKHSGHIYHTHYNPITSSFKGMNEWGLQASKMLLEICEKKKGPGCSTLHPILMCRGMSGYSLAIILFMAWTRRTGIELGLMLIRKDEDINHGRKIEYTGPSFWDDYDNHIFVFIDDFICTGETLFRCIDALDHSTYTRARKCKMICLIAKPKRNKQLGEVFFIKEMTNFKYDQPALYYQPYPVEADKNDPLKFSSELPINQIEIYYPLYAKYSFVNKLIRDSYPSESSLSSNKTISNKETVGLTLNYDINPQLITEIS